MKASLLIIRIKACSTGIVLITSVFLPYVIQNYNNLLIPERLTFQSLFLSWFTMIGRRTLGLSFSLIHLQPVSFPKVQASAFFYCSDKYQLSSNAYCNFLEVCD